MQVSITLTAESSRWAVEVAWGLDDARTVRSFTAARLDFTPWIRPGPDGIPALDDPHYAVLSGTADNLQELTRRVAALGKARLERGDLVAYGRLLFASVLAPFWDTVVAEASAAAHDLIELALHLPTAADSPLKMVPWELLHDGRSFLVTHNEVEVAITRRIPSAATTPGQISPPARVLFAIGAELSDPTVRPGAEFLGLMREVERSGWKIASYIVEKASPARLAEAVQNFKPDVVHFIAHGHLDSNKVPALLMRPDDDVPGAPTQRVTAGTLFACISVGGRVPPMVVLAACESGAVSSVYGALLAEDLVIDGVPIVVAMAGSVADQACRLFTRRFGTVLATGGSLLQAAADARRAAYRRGGGPPATTIDWALPSVFLSDQVSHDYRPVAVVDGISVSRRIEKFDFAEGPVFCGRSKFFGRYDELMSSGPLNVLAIYTLKDTRGLGKSRILREYGTRALLDGHVPCVVGLDGKDRPTDPRRFAKVLLTTSIAQSRRLFKLDPPVNPPALLRLLCSPATPPWPLSRIWRDWKLEVNELIDRAYQPDRPLDPGSLSAAIAADLASLIEDARASQDPRIGPASRVLVLLDTVEEWADMVDLLAPGILSQHGLGDEDEAAPVVMAFRAGAGVHDASFEGLTRFADGKRWIDAEKLEPLAEGDEEGLAYRWILLNANPAIAPPISEKVYTVVRPDGQWRNLFGIFTDRIPAKLSDTKFYSVAKALLQQEELAEGDDDEALAFLLGSRP